MRAQVLTLALCLAWLAPDLVPIAAQDRTGAFMLSVLRRDGLVVPFAAFDGRRWSRRWPDRIPLELPISIDDVPESWWGIEPPPARRMKLWNAGAPAGEVTVTGLSISRLMCQPRLALGSDYKASTPVPPPLVLPYPKDGLLVAGSVPVATIDTVEPGNADWKMVLTLATNEFNKRENSAAGAFTSWKHPVKANQRKLVPITMEALYRAPTDDPGWTAYFMEAVRQYPPGPADKDGCGLATYVSGWVLVGPKDRTRMKLSAQVTYCDRKGVGYMLPFGLITANEKTYWVFQYSGFEFESYEVIRPHSGGVDVEVVFTAGVCAR